MVLLAADVAPSGYAFWTNLLINALATILAGLIGGAILVSYSTAMGQKQSLWPGHPFYPARLHPHHLLCDDPCLCHQGDHHRRESNRTKRSSCIILVSHVRSLRFLKDYFLWLFIVLCTIAGFMVNDKYGPGNLRSFFMGRYFRPQREEHIFMFLDLRASTYIAQVLGEQQYFNFIKDVIRDATPVILRHKGRIYQYVGDEITVSWWMNQGLNKLNCIRCPMEIRKIFNHRSSYYTAQYGVVPDFKAGLHCGPVMVGEIGVVKRDIAFSGEVVGTAARIQNRCNHLEVNLLMSQDLKDLLPWQGSRLVPEHKGDLLIKGKMVNLPLYTVNAE